jgi:hypothetical protein
MAMPTLPAQWSGHVGGTDFMDVIDIPPSLPLSVWRISKVLGRIVAIALVYMLYTDTKASQA